MGNERPTEITEVTEVHIYRDDRFPEGHEPIVFDLGEDVTLQAGETISITWNDRGNGHAETDEVIFAWDGRGIWRFG